MDDEPRALHASLSGGDEGGEQYGCHSALDRRVRKHHHRRLAAEFRRYTSQVAARYRGDGFACFRSASEIDLGNTRARRQRETGCGAIAGDNVVDAVGHTGFLEDVAEQERRDWGEL